MGSWGESWSLARAPEEEEWVTSVRKTVPLGKTPQCHSKGHSQSKFGSSPGGRREARSRRTDTLKVRGGSWGRPVRRKTQPPGGPEATTAGGARRADPLHHREPG